MEDNTSRLDLSPTIVDQEQLEAASKPRHDECARAKGSLIYGTAWKKQRTADLVYQAVRAGFRAFATAAQPKHYEEPLVGQGLSRAIAEGIVTRTELFIQTTFTPLSSQDPESVPYDKDEHPVSQAQKSIKSSLDLFRDPISGHAYLDAVVLHTPYPDPVTTARVLGAIASMGIGPCGPLRRLGISNVTAAELQDLLEREAPMPQIVQNRCRLADGLDRSTRAFCKSHRIEYQAFGILRNEALLRDGDTVLEVAHELTVSREAALYALLVVVLGDEGPFSNKSDNFKVLNGTTDVEHMREDLEQVDKALIALKVAALGHENQFLNVNTDLRGRTESREHGLEASGQLGDQRGVTAEDIRNRKLRQAMRSFKDGIGES